MTKFLRTASTRRLLATIAAVVVAIAAGTAIAVAAAGSGPVPPKTSLSKAIHNAMAAPPLQGISARISFTNHLVNASDFQGVADPIMTGATGRLWLSNDGRLRLELQSDNGDAQIVVNNDYWWIYDPTSQTAYEGTLPAQTGGKDPSKHDTGHEVLPSIGTIQRYINRLAQHLNISGAIPGDVAGRPTYTVRISPKHDGGLLGSAQLAWDALRGVPLRIAIYASHQSSPVLELKATDISYGKVPSSVFPTSPPQGAKVVKVATPTGAGAHAAAERTGRHAEVTGVKAVASHLPFALVAPRVLKHDGLVRRSVTLLDWAGTPAALITYGQNLGGVAVIEQLAKPGAQSSGGGPGGLSLPTVSIRGASAQELSTPLGTLLRFTRNGVSYTVIGSVPAVAAELAARAL
jgi:outer membrane lipoprotein-sorting protein